jgi:hypothetical protein
MAEASLKTPDGTIKDVIFPVVSEVFKRYQYLKSMLIVNNVIMMLELIYLLMGYYVVVGKKLY